MKKFIIEIDYEGPEELTTQALFDIIASQMDSNYCGELKDLVVSEA